MVWQTQTRGTSVVWRAPAVRHHVALRFRSPVRQLPRAEISKCMTWEAKADRSLQCAGIIAVMICRLVTEHGKGGNQSINQSVNPLCQKQITASPSVSHNSATSTAAVHLVPSAPYLGVISRSQHVRRLVNPNPPCVANMPVSRPWAAVACR